MHMIEIAIFTADVDRVADFYEKLLRVQACAPTYLRDPDGRLVELKQHGD